MKILGLSTSSKVLSISVYDDREELARFHEVLGQERSNYLISYIRKILSSIKLELSDMDLLALDIGPGSFTGLRVGVTSVKVIAKILDLPVVGVPSLDIIAASINSENKPKCVVLDAKRGKVYAAFYKNGTILGNYLLLDIKELIERIHQDMIFIGDGVEKYKHRIEQNLSKSGIEFDFAPGEKNYPDSSYLVKLGIGKFQSYGAEDVDKLVPMYLYSKECSIKGI